MTEVVAMIRRSDFEAALAAARMIGAGELTGLAAPLGRTAMARLDKAWNAVEQAMRAAYERGREAADQLIADAVATTEKLLLEAQRGADLRDELMARMQTWLADIVDRCLQTVRTSVTVGDRALDLAMVQVHHSIRVGGSLKASITDLCSLAADGQLTVVAEYRVAPT